MPSMHPLCGSVTLADEDARKFRNQAIYGRPRKEAHESAERGVRMARELKENGGKMTIGITDSQSQAMGRIL